MTLVIKTPSQVRLHEAWWRLLLIPRRLLARLGLLKPRVRHAVGYWRAGVTYVHAEEELGPGHLRAKPPAARFESDASSAAIGRAIHEALAAYRIWVAAPHVRSAAYKAWLAGYFATLDATTNAQVMKGSKSVGITLENGIIRFHPWRNEGARMGFTPMPPEAAIELPADAAPHDLGQALVDAFTRCD